MRVAIERQPVCEKWARNKYIGRQKTVESIEASGKSVDEAVQQALMRLGKRRDEVEITVLQEPSRGTFGIGSKDARVRVSARPGGVGAVITPEMADAILGPDDTYPGQEIFSEEDEDEFDEDEEVDEFAEEDEDEFDEDEEMDEDEFDEDEEEELTPILNLHGAAAFSPEL